LCFSVLHKAIYYSMQQQQQQQQQQRFVDWIGDNSVIAISRPLLSPQPSPLPSCHFPRCNAPADTVVDVPTKTFIANAEENDDDDDDDDDESRHYVVNRYAYCNTHAAGLRYVPPDKLPHKVRYSNDPYVWWIQTRDSGSVIARLTDYTGHNLILCPPQS